jgi:DNA repair protein RecO (recombination protein O)
MIVTTPAIILHARNYSESSRIVQVYTIECGKLTILAKGVRKPGSTFGSALEPMGESVLTIYVKHGRDIQLVSKAEQLQSRKRLRASYDHMVAGLAVCECILRTQVDGERNVEVYDVVQRALHQLETSDAPWSSGVMARLRLADVMGFGIPDPGLPSNAGPVRLRIEDGVVFTRATAASDGTIPLSADAWQMISAVWQREVAPSNDPPYNVRLEIEAFLAAYFSVHLDKRIGSRTFDVLGGR